MLKIALLIASLSLVACGKNLPEFPEVVQYALKNKDVEKPGFYGVNNKTHAHVFRDCNDPAMDGAQALSADDYKKSEAWVKSVEDLAQTNCK